MMQRGMRFIDPLLNNFNDVNAKFNGIVTQFENPPMKIHRDQCNIKFITLLTCIKYKVFIKN